MFVLKYLQTLKTILSFCCLKRFETEVSGKRFAAMYLYYLLFFNILKSEIVEVTIY